MDEKYMSAVLQSKIKSNDPLCGWEASGVDPKPNFELRQYYCLPGTCHAKTLIHSY